MSRHQLFAENVFDSSTENNWDYARNNVEFEIAPSAIRSAGTSFTGFTNHNASALYLFVDITLNASGVVITPFIEWLDPVSGNKATIQTGNGFSIVAGGIEIFTLVPRSFQVGISHDIAGDVTYSLGGCLINGG